MLFAKCKKIDAQKLKYKLIEEKIYFFNVKPFNDEKWTYFPLNSNYNTKQFIDLKVIEKKDYKVYNNRTKSLKKILTEMNLTKNQIKYISSFDTISDIAILKITPDLKPYKFKIAKALLETNKSLRTIVEKTQEHHGIYRIQSVKWLAGKKSFSTVVKESGAKFKVKVGDMFFSPRLSFERLRIAKKIKPKSNVAVFFAGVAPFSIVIAKIQPLVNKILSIELNPKAHKLALENVVLNKIENKVIPILDDVNNFAKNTKYQNWADYIIMPLPKSSNTFIESAFKVIKKNKNKKDCGIISLYKFVPKKDPFKDIVKELEVFAKSKGYKLDIVFKRKVRDFSSKIIQIVIEFRFISRL